MLKTDVEWPIERQYISDTEQEPVKFFSDALCNSFRFDLMLGFFSSSAINVLADGFAAFIYNGGRMRMIINDILSVEDQAAVCVGENNLEIPYFDICSLENLRIRLSHRDEHFFECLSWLIRNDKIEIKIVVPKSGKGIAHTKFGLFADSYTKVGFDGSCNFTRSALVDNMESISIFCDWDSPTDSIRVANIETKFNNTFNGTDNNVIYKEADSVRTYIRSNFKEKNLFELLSDEAEIISKESQLSDFIRPSVLKVLVKIKNRLDGIIKELNIKVSSVDSIPRFPYESGPRKYQQEAYENWKNNGQRGLFAMATGTGKTITSLNCLLEIYKRRNYYKAIILVPTVTLVNQWEQECRKFNFNLIYKVSSKNPNWKDDISRIKSQELFDNKEERVSYIIIATYSSFSRDKSYNILNSFDAKRVLLIADEAHNMGATGIRKKLNGVNYLRRIGLSATPERQFDITGNRVLNDFFSVVNNKYTFEYSMEEAIRKEVLCKYYYYPHLVELTFDEMQSYNEISLKIAKFGPIDLSLPRPKDDPLTMLLLARKRIIHKAENKKKVFKKIIEERLKEKSNLKYTLVYVPEGNKPDDAFADSYDTSDMIIDDDYSGHLIDEYTEIVKNANPFITVKEFTSNSVERDRMLKQFATGELEVLTSMKCLDEGVDVPRSEMAIFCASTGNPRQFIQRRGRILRQCKPDKRYAVIHDLIVAPIIGNTSESYEIERSMLQGELRRVKDFALLSENSVAALVELEDVMNYYNVSMF
jgi:superfamily II DNA or RNA helicase